MKVWRRKWELLVWEEGHLKKKEEKRKETVPMTIIKEEKKKVMMQNIAAHQ